jgi:hypothetical protein
VLFMRVHAAFMRVYALGRACRTLVVLVPVPGALVGAAAPGLQGHHHQRDAERGHQGDSGQLDQPGQ